MANFDLAIPFILQNEGGYSDDSNDYGGETNYGLTRLDLSLFYAKPMEEVDVKNLSPTVAKEIYKKLYWDAVGLTAVQNQSIATVLFDIAVNRGISASTKSLQLILNVSVDGVFGPQTTNALNLAVPSDVIKELFKRDIIAYAMIVTHDPSQVAFIVGWQKRALRYLDFI